MRVADTHVEQDDRPLRVMHVAEAIGGGLARQVVDLVKGMPDVESIVVSPRRRVGGYTDTTALPTLEATGASVRVVPMVRSVVSPVNMVAILRIAWLIRRTKPDIVHAHAAVAGAVARIAAVLSPGVKVIYSSHALMPNRAAHLVERLLARLTDRIVAVSPGEAEVLVTNRIGVPEQIATIPNGISRREPEDDPDLRELLNVPRGTPVVGCVARLVKQKGIDNFIAAAEMLLAQDPEVHVVLIGEGPLYELAAKAQRRLDRFHWLAGLEKARSVIWQMDALILLSRYEGAPITLLEALDAGVPVVASDVTGNRDVLGYGKAGGLVPLGDAEQAVVATRRALARSEGVLREIALGRELLQMAYASETMVFRTHALYAELVDRPVGGRTPSPRAARTITTGVERLASTK